MSALSASLRCSRRHRLLAGLVGVVALGATVGPGGIAAGIAQTVDEDLWVTNGPVHAMVKNDLTIYIGGEFSYVGPSTGGGVPLSLASGESPTSFPKVTGVVNAAISDGAGGWYIGGQFTAVGGVPRSHVAHIRSDMTVSAWSPRVGLYENFGPPLVYALALTGSTVCIGGSFDSIDDTPRNNIAAVDPVTGALKTWKLDDGPISGFPPPGANGIVYALTLDSSDSTLYVGGSFEYIAGHHRPGIAAVDVDTGALTPWALPISGVVRSIVARDSRVYVGGDYYALAYRNLAAVSAETGNLVFSWYPDGQVLTLALSGSTLYAGGGFRRVVGQDHRCIAAIDVATAQVGSWNPDTDGIIRAIGVDGDNVYVGGDFTRIGGALRHCLAALDRTTAAATPWDPSASSAVHVIALDGSGLYVGGAFSSLGGKPRGNLAALDAVTGAATPWNPHASGPVFALALSSSTVYIGGQYLNLGESVRRSIAAVDATTGEVTPWDPGADYLGRIYTLALSESTLYVGGLFTNIDGESRRNLAELDISSGHATAWNPDPNGFVHVLAVKDDKVYVGGTFSRVGGQARNGIAALDTVSGVATNWNPSANDNASVHALVVTDGLVYVGGYYRQIGGEERNGISSLSVTTAVATAWNPGLKDGDRVSALALRGNTLYVGGGFRDIGMHERHNLAALDATSGSATDWRANVNGGISALLVGDRVHVAGHFTNINDVPQTHVASIYEVPTSTLLSHVSTVAEPGRVQITWWPVERQFATATVYRRFEYEDWISLDEISPDGAGRLLFQDSGLMEGARYGYRLGILREGVEYFAGETWVQVPRTSGLALAGLSPNPASRSLNVRFSLPDASPARLEVLDLAGRRVLGKDVGTLGRGTHTVDLTFERRFSPGVYHVRLTRGRESLAARAVIVR